MKEKCQICGQKFESEDSLLEHQFYESTKSGDFIN